MGLGPTKEFTVQQPHVRLGDPHVWSDDTSHLSLRWAVYEPLVFYDRQGRYRPGLAENWTVTEDARTWQFRLRDDVTFHNGQRLTAEAVVASLDRARDPHMAGELGTGGLYQSYLGNGELQALDEQTLRIVLRAPMADLLDLLVEIPIVAPAALDHLPEAHTGTGPYRLVETVDDAVTMAAFDEYWGGRPPIERLSWQAQPEEARRVQALLAGRADLVSQVAPDSRETLIAGDSVHLVQAPSSMCVIFICNAQSGPCADSRVRQALNYALDVETLIRQIKGGAAQALHGPLTPLHMGYDPAVPPYLYDPDKARALLAEAGYVAGLKLELDIPTTHPDEAPRLAKEMVRQYARVGITTQIYTQRDRPAYADQVKAKKIHDACCFDSSPLSSYRSLREKFHSGIAGPWWQGYHNQKLNTLLEQAWGTTDDVQRQKLYRRAYRIIRDDAAWVFLYNPTYFWGMRSRAQGWKAGIDGSIRLA